MEEAAREPTILSVETVMESIIWYLHIQAPFTLFHTYHLITTLPYCWMNSSYVSIAPAGLWIPGTVPYSSVYPMHLAAQCHTQSRCVQKYLPCDRVPPLCKCVPPRTWQLWLMLHPPIHWQWYLARYIKLREDLFHGKFTSSALFQFIPSWKSPSGGSYVGWHLGVYGLTNLGLHD